MAERLGEIKGSLDKADIRPLPDACHDMIEFIQERHRFSDNNTLFIRYGHLYDINRGKPVKEVLGDAIYSALGL